MTEVGYGGVRGIQNFYKNEFLGKRDRLWNSCISMRNQYDGKVADNLKYGTTISVQEPSESSAAKEAAKSLKRANTSTATVRLSDGAPGGPLLCQIPIRPPIISKPSFHSGATFTVPISSPSSSNKPSLNKSIAIKAGTPSPSTNNHPIIPNKPSSHANSKPVISASAGTPSSVSVPLKSPGIVPINNSFASGSEMSVVYRSSPVIPNKPIHSSSSSSKSSISGSTNAKSSSKSSSSGHKSSSSSTLKSSHHSSCKSGSSKSSSSSKSYSSSGGGKSSSSHSQSTSSSSSNSKSKKKTSRPTERPDSLASVIPKG